MSVNNPVLTRIAFEGIAHDLERFDHVPDPFEDGLIDQFLEDA